MDMDCLFLFARASLREQARLTSLSRGGLNLACVLLKFSTDVCIECIFFLPHLTLVNIPVDKIWIGAPKKNTIVLVANREISANDVCY